MTALYRAFREVAQQYPARPALRDESLEYSYEAAMARVTRLGLHLAQGPQGAAVLLIGPKQCDTVLWQLACNHAGLVFVPFDSATPADRLRGALQRIRPKWVVSDDSRNFSDEGYTLKARTNTQQIWVRPDFQCYAPDVSHIIFSSGSTGRPKGILLRDTPVVAVVRAQSKLLGITPQSRFAWLLSPAFDASLSDVYATLLSGAELHVCSFGASRLKSLRSYFNDQGITHSDLPPSVLPLLNPAEFPHLKALIFGGELAREDVVQSWTALGKVLFNAYGPTETTICSSMRLADDSWNATNIGTPLPGVSYFVRTAQGVELPTAGATGELVIAGDHLAYGYDTPSLTEARFVQARGVRCYLTGDLVEVAANGDFQYKGRVDRQMKFHGVLICPEEVELLALRAGCTEALLRLESERLVMHYSGNVTPADLKQALQRGLIPSAVPQRYCHVESLPKLLTGKVAP